MLCKHCSSQIPEGATFCPTCGKMQNAQQTQPSKNVQTKQAPTAQNLRVRKKAAPIVLLVFAAIALSISAPLPTFAIIVGIGFLIPLFIFSIKNNRRVISIIGSCLAVIAIIIGISVVNLRDIDNDKPAVNQVSSETNAEVTVTNIVEPTHQIKEEYLLGEIAPLEGTLVQVVSIEKSDGSDFDTPKDGYEYVIVSIAIKNNGDYTISYNPYDFEMQNSQGQVVDIAFSIIDAETALHSGELLPGGYIEGTLVFEQPREDSGLELIYNPSFWDDDSIRFNLMQGIENPEILSGDKILWEGKEYGQNEAGTLDGAQITVTKIEKSDGSDWDKPKQGYEYIVVSVEIKNVGNGKLGYNPYYFAIVNSMGQITNTDFIIIDSDTALESGELIEGGVVSGTIAFEQPKDDPELRLIYNGDSIFSLFGEEQLMFVLD